MGKNKKHHPVAIPPPSSTKGPRVTAGSVDIRGKEIRLEKNPATAEQEMMGSKPAWHVSILETKDPFGWHKIDLATFEHIQERLKNFESMTWKEILVAGGGENHAIPVGNLIKVARDRLYELDLFGAEKVVSLRLTGKRRIWGVWDAENKAVLKLLWWDPKHEICPSNKKNT